MLFDARGIIGACILALLALCGLHGATITVAQKEAPKKADAPAGPEKRKPLLPILPRRPLRDVQAAGLKMPHGRWNPQTKEYDTTGYESFVGKAQVGDSVSPDGAEEVLCDIPKELHLRNRGGSDGAGLCVFCSLKHASCWQHVWATTNIFEFMFTRPGGGYPQKVDKVIKDLCAQQNVPVPGYVQVQNKDLEVLKLACKTGRMPGVTYSFSPTGRYNGRRIAHMVSLVHASDRWFAVLDNNYPGSFEWMDPATFAKTYAYGGNGWAVIFLDPGPPSPPRN